MRFSIDLLDYGNSTGVFYFWSLVLVGFSYCLDVHFPPDLDTVAVLWQ